MISLRPATKISIIYLIVACLWIYLSDTILLMIFTFETPYQQMVFSIIKGIAYVLITSYLLYKLIRTFYKNIDDRITELQDKQNELTELQKITRTGLWEFDILNNKMLWSSLSREIFEVSDGFEPQPTSITNYAMESKDRVEILKALDDSAKYGTQFDLTLPVITAQGNEKWIRVVGNPIIKKEKCIKIFGSFQDISNTKKTEEKLIQLNRLYDFILQTNELMVHTTDAYILFQEICRIAVDVGKFKMAWVGHLNKITRSVDPISCAGDENGYLEMANIIADKTRAEGRGPVGKAISGEKYSVFNDIENDPHMKPWRDAALERGYRSCIALPIFKFGKVFGVFALYADIPYYFDEKEIVLLKEAAATLSHVLEYLEKEKLRKETEINLSESEEKYRQIVETANDGIWIVDKNAVTTFVNDRMAQMLGYTVSEMQGKELFDFADNEWADISRHNLENRSNGVAEVFDFKYLKKDGQHIWAKVSTAPMFKNGEYAGSLAMITDITDRKEAEEKVLETLDRYDSVIKATQETIYDFDVRNSTILYNQGMTEVFGFPPDQIENTVEWTRKNIHPTDLKRFQEVLNGKMITGDTVLRAEGRYRCADGSYKDVVVRGYLKYNEEGRPVRITGSMQDVTSVREQELLIEKAVNDTQERERQQMGMELHDNVNQILSASLLYLGKLKENFGKDEKVNDDFDTIDRYLREAVDEIRKLSHQLAPVSIKDVALKYVFEDLIETINVYDRYKVTLQIDNIDYNIVPADFKINLYRILQEQLNNIEKYSKATEVKISLKKEGDIIRFIIADNGIGFDPAKRTTGIGLENIRRRSKLLFGELEIRSAEGEGCEINIEIPTVILKMV
jgi:PAS domain S-box-containing protein